MAKVTFKNVKSRLELVKRLKEILDLKLADARDAVDSGVIDFPDDKFNDIAGAIQGCGGEIIQSVEDVVLPAKRDALDMFLESLLSGENKSKDRVNDTRVVVNCAQEIVIVSNISISERLYQRLAIIRADELKEVQKHIRLVAGLNLVPGTDKMEPTSCLAVRVPFHHNTTEEIRVLSEIARTIHETILDAASKTAVFDNIERDLKPFYDE